MIKPLYLQEVSAVKCTLNVENGPNMLMEMTWPSNQPIRCTTLMHLLILSPTPEGGDR